MEKLKYFSFALLIALCAGFVSCSDDDDDEPGQGGQAGDASMLIGTWEPTSYYYCYKINGKIVEEDRSLDGLLIQIFTENGICYGYHQDKTTLSKSGTYTYNNGKVTVTDEDGDVEQYNVSFQSKTELIFEASASAEYEGTKHEVYAKYTLRKIADFI